MKKRKLLYLFPLAALILSGCDINEVMDNAKGFVDGKIVSPVTSLFTGKKEEEQPQQEEEQKPSGEEHHEEEKPAPKEFEGLTLESATFTYDGQPHSISVQGELPQVASVDYGTTGHEFTEVGEYEVTAVISGEGYNSKTLTATLTIENAKFDREQVKLDDATVIYDGQEHTLAVTGAPDFATVEYGQNGNSFTNAGEYAISATVKAHGYENLDLSATLTIEKADFVGLKFEDAAYTVDGEPHEIKPVIPEEYADIVTVTYSEGGNAFSEIGEYEVTVTVSADNYNDWVETATLIITDKKVFEGLSLEDKTVPYNGEEQTIQYSGTLPEGAEANYLDGYKGGKLPGTYDIKVEFSCVGYHTLVLSATLTIESLELEGITMSDETVEYDGQAHTITPVIPEKYAGAQISYKENAGSFTDVGTHTVEAIVSLEGYNDWNGSAVLTILPAPLMVADFENLTSSDLVDMFTYQYYESSWTKPTKSVLELIDNQLFEGGSKTLRANNTHNGCNWRIETLEDYFDSIKTGETYKGLSLDTCVDDLRDGSKVTVKVQLKFKNLPLPEEWEMAKDDVQVTYTVSEACPTNWTHWEIPFEDESMSIKAFGSIAIEYTAVQEMGFTVYDFIPYVSQMSVLVNANSLNYEASATYIDNICFTNNDKRSSETLVKFENSEFTIASNDNTQFRLSLGDNSAKLESLNLEENAALEGTYTFNKDKLALNLSPDKGAHNVQFNLHSLMNGSLLAFDDENALTGDLAILAPYAAHTNFDGKMFNKVFLMDDFESYDATGTGYDSGNTDKASMSGLRGSYYGEMFSGSSNINGLLGDSNWKLLNASGWKNYMELRTGDEVHGKYMDVQSHGNNNVRYTNFDVVNGGAKPVGSGSNISFFAKASSSLTITFRAFYNSKIDGTIASTKDSSVSFTENIAVTTEWSQIIIPIRKNATVFGIMITAPKVNDARICIDDIQIIGEANPYAIYVEPEPEQAEPEIPENVIFGYDLQNETPNQAMANTDWTQEYYKNDAWNVNSSMMRVKELSGNVYANMKVSSYNTDYRYTYIPTGGINGAFNKFSVDLANDYNGCANIKLRIGLILADDSEVFIYGVDDYEIIPANTSQWMHVAVDNFGEVSAKGVRFHLQSCKQGGDDFLYFDNIKFSFVETLRFEYDLQNETPNQAMANTDWTQEYYKNDAWNVNSSMMRVKELSGNVYANMKVSSYNTDYRYTYIPTGGISGKVSKLSVDLANDYNGCANIKLRIGLILLDDSEVFVYGVNDFEIIPAGTSQWMNVVADNFGEVNVKGVRFHLQSCTQGGDDFLYFDNLKLSYIGGSHTHSFDSSTHECICGELDPAYAKVTFVVNYNTNAAGDLYLVGIGPGTGDEYWANNIHAMTWSEGDNWSVTLAAPIGETYEYKFVVGWNSGERTWENGENRSITISQTETLNLNWQA